MNPTRDTIANMVWSHLTMRVAVGYLGMGLPVVLYVTGLITEGLALPSSISAYYHLEDPPVRDLFVGILCATGVFLSCYKGHARKCGEWLSDNLITTAAGLAAVGVAIFPTSTRHCVAEIRAGMPEACHAATESAGCLGVTIGHLHFASAFVFFAALALMCLVQFTKSNDGGGPEKAKRNRLYRWCGGVIVASIVAIVLVKCFLKDTFIWVFLLEVVAVGAFGVSWIVKGGVLMADPQTKNN